MLGITYCCHEGTMCGERETQSKISDCERENSKKVYFKIILIQNKVPDYTLFVHFCWTMKLHWKKITKCSSWELFGMEMMWSCHVVPYSLWSWPHLISPLLSSFLASITTLTCTHNCAEYITHSLVAAHSSTVSTELQYMMRGISLKSLVSFMRTWW